MVEMTQGPSLKQLWGLDSKSNPLFPAGKGPVQVKLGDLGSKSGSPMLSQKELEPDLIRKTVREG